MIGTAHLLHGFVGAGKTTLARRLEGSLPALRLTHDEWMVHLFGVAPPPDTFAERYEQIDGLVWRVALRVLELGQHVVFDSGFWSRADRDRARERLASIDAPVRLVHVACPEDVMRRRVAARTAELPDGALWINDEAFDLFRARFEPLGADEEHVVVDGSVE